MKQIFRPLHLPVKLFLIQRKEKELAIDVMENSIGMFHFSG
jgi:hypothetical protein